LADRLIVTNVHLPEWLLRRLRGDYNSVRYRFVGLPREWAVYTWFRMTGRSWIDFYGQRLDGHAGTSIRSNKPPKESYLAQAEEHVAFLKSKGLEPHHDFLDYGCGILRLGRLVIPYLEANRYVGVEISAERLQRGESLMANEGDYGGTYQTVLVANCELRELGDKTFDYVWAKSVLTHMPKADIKALLTALRKHLKPDGRFYFTFAQSDRVDRRNIKDFYYPESTIRKWATEAGYDLIIEPSWDPVAHGDTMACATLKTQ
jgi:cyclopropane fatty-acyl-phospholipid synthase-like methyltransferase